MRASDGVVVGGVGCVCVREIFSDCVIVTGFLLDLFIGRGSDSLFSYTSSSSSSFLNDF